MEKKIEKSKGGGVQQPPLKKKLLKPLDIGQFTIMNDAVYATQAAGVVEENRYERHISCNSMRFSLFG